MERIGACEARKRLPQLLERVAGGERITITRNSVPVAMLVPHPGTQRPEVASAIEELLELRRGRTLDGLTIRGLIDEGRR